MSDHERFVLLAARQLSEALSAEEQAELEAHLAACPECRSIAAGMRRDDMRLRAELGGVAVAPRVRRRVLDEAAGRRRVDARLFLLLAAALVLAAVGIPLIAGGRLGLEPSPPVTTQSPVPAATPPPSSSPSVASSPVAVPSLLPSPTGTGPFVAGAYTYGVSELRRDTVAAHFEGGRPVGEWSRTVPATGQGETFAGSVTCLEVSGSDAWMAGPITTATDGSTGGAVMAYFHDGGPDEGDDAVVLWQSTTGQTLTTMTGWCESRFIPAGPFPLLSGDVVVEDGLP